jgi:hypothetical protein
MRWRNGLMPMPRPAIILTVAPAPAIYRSSGLVHCRVARRTFTSRRSQNYVNLSIHTAPDVRRCHDIAASERGGSDLHGEAAQTNFSPNQKLGSAGYGSPYRHLVRIDLH